MIMWKCKRKLACMNKLLIKKLREGRIQKGLTQSEVAKKLGIKNTTISNYENGVTEPDIDTFLHLCDLYEINYNDFLGEAYGLKVQGSDEVVRPSELWLLHSFRQLTPYDQETVRINIERMLRDPAACWPDEE